MVDSETLYNLFYFNIDKYINPYMPRNYLNVLPKSISHFLGHRYSTSKEPPALVQWTLTLFSTVAGICLVGGIFNYAPDIAKWNPPTLVVSLGASAVLEYNAVRSPLAQPRNAIVGHTLAAIVGVAISKLFQLNTDFEALRWVAGAVGCATASLVMSVTNTVHPPGGATAVLACTEAQVIALGWMLPPLILLASILMTAVACIFNNTLRQYPLYWWTSDDVGHLRCHGGGENEPKDVEGGDVKKVDISRTTSSDRTLAHKLSNHVDFIEGLDGVCVTPYRIQLPPHVELNNTEIMLLKHLQERMRTNTEVN